MSRTSSASTRQAFDLRWFCHIDVSSETLGLRLGADENFSTDIVRRLLGRGPDLDIVRVQDAGLSGADDAPVLEWAANERRAW